MMKIITKFNMFESHLDIDPYGEEIWSTNVDNVISGLERELSWAIPKIEKIGQRQLDRSAFKYVDPNMVYNMIVPHQSSLKRDIKIIIRGLGAQPGKVTRFNWGDEDEYIFEIILKNDDY